MDLQVILHELELGSVFLSTHFSLRQCVKTQRSPVCGVNTNKTDDSAHDQRTARLRRSGEKVLFTPGSEPPLFGGHNGGLSLPRVTLSVQGQ